LEPVDSSEFTQQLVLFTSAEQAVATNKHLEALINLSTATQTVGAVSYIGKTIQAEGKTSTLAGGAATWNYTLPSSASETLITITDASGKVVFNGKGESAAGIHRFAWDGRDNQGVTQPDGSYTIAISAKNARGEPITANTSIVGKVDSVETVDGGIVLAIGTTKVPFDKVQVVKESPAVQ
jgi:flagellar basal-body rod modification protein FlgD